MIELKKVTPARRRITKAKITHISLCKRGANEQPVLLKSGDRVAFDTLVKADMAEGLLTALVYVPERPDFEGDVASREVVKQMAHDFIANGAQVDIEHNLKAQSPEAVRVAETFLVQKGDPRFADWKDYAGNPVDATDAWAVVLKIEDPELRKLYTQGDWNGVSMYGRAQVEQVAKADVGSFVFPKTDARVKDGNDHFPIGDEAHARNALSRMMQYDNSPPWFDGTLAELHGIIARAVHRKFPGIMVSEPAGGANPTQKSQEDDMNLQELQAALAANNAALAETLIKAMKPAEPEKKTESVPFEGDPFNAEDVAKHAEMVLFKSLDLTKPADLKKWQDHLAVKAKAEAEKAEALRKAQTPEEQAKQAKIDALEAEIKKLQGASGQKAGDPAPEVQETVGLSKSEAALLEKGRKIGQAHTKARG